MTTTTAAQRISALLGEDGRKFSAADGRTLSEMVETEGGRSEWRDGWRTGDVVRHTFRDGSAITVAGDAWDFGYTDCFCWAGAGHTEECTANGTPIYPLDGEDELGR